MVTRPTSSLDALVSTLPLVVYTATVDDDPRPRYVSPKISELLGVSPEEFTFDLLRNWLHPDDRAATVRAFEEADARHEGLTLEYRLVRRDGRVVWVEDNSRIVTVDGETLAQGYLLDITERKRTEAMLTRDAAIRRRVADVGRIALQGAPYDEIVRMSLDVLHDGVDADVGTFLELVDGQLVVTQAFGWEAAGAVALAGTPARTAFDTGRTFVGPIDPTNPESLLSRMGMRSTIAVPVSVDGGPCFGVIAIHLKRAEGFSPFDVSLVEQTANLVGAAASRERLEQRLRRAERLEAVGQLAAGVAHDFNNLLQAIAGYTELAAGRSEGQVSGYLAHVSDAAARAKTLTAQLLAYSRKQDLQPARVSLTDLVSSVTPMLRPLLGDGVRLEAGSDELVVVADRDKLENAIINLAANGRDAMPHGGTLRITGTAVEVDDLLAAEQQVVPGRYAEIGVADTGEGMPPEVAERIFEPFFTTKPREKGTGLGLASVVGTIRQSGGFVTVDTAVGEGTTVAMFLPLAT